MQLALERQEVVKSWLQAFAAGLLLHPTISACGTHMPVQRFSSSAIQPLRNYRGFKLAFAAGSELLLS